MHDHVKLHSGIICIWTSVNFESVALLTVWVTRLRANQKALIILKSNKRAMEQSRSDQPAHTSSRWSLQVRFVESGLQIFPVLHLRFFQICFLVCRKPNKTFVWANGFLQMSVTVSESPKRLWSSIQKEGKASHFRHPRYLQHVWSTQCRTKACNRLSK